MMVAMLSGTGCGRGFVVHQCLVWGCPQIVDTLLSCFVVKQRLSFLLVGL